MARTRPRTPTSKLPAPRAIRAAQIRYTLQGDLRALAIPPQPVRVSDPAVPMAEIAREAGDRGRLGEYLRASNLITAHDLAAALAEQRQRLAAGRPIALGDLLVEQGHLTAHQLVNVLMLQYLDRAQGSSVTAAPPLGELLVRAGLITTEQLATALSIQTEARQRGEAIRLGEILIALGLLSHQDLATSLRYQRRTRRR